MKRIPEEDQALARGLFVLAAFTLVNSMMAFFLWWPVAGVTVWQWAQAVAVQACALAVLLSIRERPEWVDDVLGYVVTASILLAFWVTNGELAYSTDRFSSFAGVKLAMLAVGVFAPAEWRLGIPVLASLTLLAPVEYATWSPDARTNVALPEPWGTAAFGSICIGLFLFRGRLAKARLDAARSHAEAAAAERFARKLLAIRDLANSPMQAIELDVAILRAGHADRDWLATSMERALARLRELNAVLASYEADVSWRPGDVAFDPLELLQRRAQG